MEAELYGAACVKSVILAWIYISDGRYRYQTGDIHGYTNRTGDIVYQTGDIHIGWEIYTSTGDIDIGREIYISDGGYTYRKGDIVYQTGDIDIGREDTQIGQEL